MFLHSDHIALYKSASHHAEDVCNSAWIDLKVRMDAEDFFNGLPNSNGS